jgi:hypothetical protein
MTTLAVDTYRVLEIGDRNEIPCIAADKFYEGSAIGIVDASGHARPLTSADRFAGFCEKYVDNSAGAAAALNVRVIKKGAVQLPVSGAVITDVGQPVYATDDNAFGFTPVSAVFIGFVRRYVSSGVVIVEFDAGVLQDPYAGWTPEALGAATKTLDVQDAGKAFFVTVDSVITLPATAVSISVLLVNVGPFGTVQISADPVTADKIMGPDIAGADNKDLINTKATARRGDRVELRLGHADGPFVEKLVGTWAQEA